jgi:hypothetical protein
MIRQCVDDLSAGKDVEADENNIIGEKHERRKYISNSALPKGIVSKITYCRQICQSTVPNKGASDLYENHMIPKSTYRYL